MIRSYTYTNFDGRLKALIMRPSTKDNYFYFEIWNMSTGDYCGSGCATENDIKNFLSKYEVEF